MLLSFTLMSGIFEFVVFLEKINYVVPVDCLGIRYQVSLQFQYGFIVGNNISEYASRDLTSIWSKHTLVSGVATHPPCFTSPYSLCRYNPFIDLRESHLQGLKEIVDEPFRFEAEHASAVARGNKVLWIAFRQRRVLRWSYVLR